MFLIRRCPFFILRIFISPNLFPSIELIKSTQLLSLDFKEISRIVKKPLFKYTWLAAHHRFRETDLKFFLKNSTHALTAWAWRNLSLTSTLKWCTFKRLFHSVTFFDVIFDREKEAVQAQNTKNNSEFRHDAYN